MHDGPAFYGHDLFGEPVRPTAGGVLAARFLFPPFSTLDARGGPWQERKRAWISLGIQSELGREQALTYTIPIGAWNPNRMDDEYHGRIARFGTSIFDPVLCEIVYRWFAPVGGTVVDPFAGGSVRGVVASALGLRYWGSDLAEAQIVANRDQASRITVDPVPTWVVGDSRVTLATAPDADLIFTCPPYGDLEVYSDDPRDLSTMGYEAFLEALSTIIRAATARLRRDRFAAIVVGDFRSPAGVLRGFPSDTIDVFAGAGLALYNEAILLTAIGGAAVRTRQFTASRKLVRTHQHLLVFVKGDPRAAADAARPIPRDEEVD